MSTSLNHCKKMRAEPGRRFLTQPAAKLEPVILDHNFWSRNASKTVKGSKNVDSSPVSNENFSKILPSSGWAQVRYRLCYETINWWFLVPD